MNEVSEFLPTDGLPNTIYSGRSETRWLDLDWHEEYRARGGHPVYSENDITYAFNKHGYRCEEFDAAADIRMVSVGCSYVMGIGLPRHRLFHEQFAARLQSYSGRTIVNWNLALPGASNDYICRLVLLATSCLRPQIVVVNFTHAGRREYASLANRLVPYNPGVRVDDRIGREICSHFDALSSPIDDQLNLFRNYKAIEALLRDRTWIFSAIRSEAFEAVSSHMDQEHFAGCLETTDLARDYAHPGPLSHDNLFTSYWDRFLELEAAKKHSFADGCG